MDWVAASRDAVDKARDEIMVTLDNVLGDYGRVGRKLIDEIYSSVRKSLDDIDQTIPED